MARRARRTPAEKYQEELAQVQASIGQYEESLETLRSKEQKLKEQIMLEKFKEVNELLETQDMSMDDLKTLLTQVSGSESVRIA